MMPDARDLRRTAALRSQAVLIALAAFGLPAAGQAPTGLAASALADSSFHWIPRIRGQFRVSFLADSYPARHQDSLLARLEPALAHARQFVRAPHTTAPIDLFFIETREQMARLIGAPATGFAHRAARAVFLVTNPTWRAFERHELMHLVAHEAWGPAAPNADWLVEGLAQAADGQCAGQRNADVLLALVARRGWIPLTAVLSQFRSQPDLRAYLQAAAFVGFLHERFGPEPLQALWTQGATEASLIRGQSLGSLEEQWRAQLRTSWNPEPGRLDYIEATGCG